MKFNISRQSVYEITSWRGLALCCAPIMFGYHLSWACESQVSAKNEGAGETQHPGVQGQLT